jgi:hypothetical protein
VVHTLEEAKKPCYLFGMSCVNNQQDGEEEGDFDVQRFYPMYLSRLDALQALIS